MVELIRILGLLRGSWRWLLLGIGLSVAVILANVALLALAGWFIAAMALAGLGERTIEYFTPAAAIRGLAVLRSVGRYGERLITHEATFRLLSQLRVWFYEHLEPLAPAGLQRHRGADIATRLRADIDSLDNFYLRILGPTVSAAIVVVLVTIFIGTFSPTIAAIGLAGLLAAGVALPLAATRLGAIAGRAVIAARSDLASGVADMVRGARELRVYRAEARRVEALRRVDDGLIAAQRRAVRIDAASAALTMLATQLSLWGALILALPRVADGLLTGPQLAMIGLCVLAAFDAVSPLPDAYRALGETLAAARRIFEIMDTPPSVAEPARSATPASGFDIKIADLRMRYADDEPWVLDRISVSIPDGGCLAVTGASGAGKTSLINVLLRFCEFQEGRIEIGGVDLRAIGGAAMRRSCAVVMQQPHMFNTTIRENLRLARPDAADAELWSALGAAALHDEVAAMPDGLDTEIGEAATALSVGQARRLALARAILKDAPILILDEPTESLDAATERAVLVGLRRFMRGRTTLLLTHRQAPLALSERVIALDAATVRARTGSSVATSMV